jgi:hypothetical protein
MVFFYFVRQAGNLNLRRDNKTWTRWTNAFAAAEACHLRTKSPSTRSIVACLFSRISLTGNPNVSLAILIQRSLSTKTMQVLC